MTSSQYELACNYFHEPPTNRRRGISYLTKAAEGGHAEAQNMLGECLRDGYGVRKSCEKAVVWFRCAANQGHADALLSLGYAFFYGEGVKKNQKEALKWYRKAARCGNDSAEYNIGHMYRFGQSMQKNLDRAIFWYKKAANNGNREAMFCLGLIYCEDKKNERKALSWYLKAARRRHYSAGLHIAHMYRIGKGIHQNWKRAIIWYQKAANIGNIEAMRWLGCIYDGKANYPRDSQPTSEWMKLVAANVDTDIYRRVAAKDEKWACFLLGLCYLNGSGVKNNSRWACYWLKRAANLGIKEARHKLLNMETKTQNA